MGLFVDSSIRKTPKLARQFGSFFTMVWNAKSFLTLILEQSLHPQLARRLQC